MIERSIIWQNPYDRSTELCLLSASASGHSLEGVVLIPVEDEPAKVAYHVETDSAWTARRAHLRIQASTWEREIELTHEDGRWIVDRRPEPSLDGCTDLDLRITPATNTLPIRRLGLGVGERAQVRAAWVGFPDLQVLAADQLYERLTEDTFRYGSNGFTADLRVEDAGLVLQYGEEYWHAIAIHQPPGA